MYKKKGCLLTAALLLSATSAQATLIDFTANNTDTVTAGGVTASVSGSGALTYQSFDGGSCPTALLACNNDGIGIVDDEVTFGSEALIVDFSQSIEISAIHVFDLFGYGDDGVGNLFEVATIEFFDASSVLLDTWNIAGTAAPGTLAGYASQSGSVMDVARMRLATTSVSGFENSDFSLAGLEYVSVPEPATLSLLGAGLLGFSLSRRRRRSQD